MSEDSKNQVAWVSLFEKYDILNQLEADQLFSITSTAINQFRESRLMTKFDNTKQLPDIFSDNNIGILPTSRGSYVLGRFNIFHKFENIGDELQHHRFNNNYESLDFNNISSESMAISCAYVSKILEDFIGEELVPTVSGRMGTSSFEFNLDDLGVSKITVDKAQIEIDGGFESENSFILIEAKNYISDDFIVRQLYYPYRKWKETIHKNVRNIYLTYSNGIFELREYAFLIVEGYNSISLLNSKKYTIFNTVINIETIQEILKNAKIEAEPNDVPFPQANSLERIFNLCELINSSEILSKVEITENYAFDSRQTDYYLNACKYLGLVEIGVNNGLVSAWLSAKGKALFRGDINHRRVTFIELILSRNAFNETLKLYLSKANKPTITEIVAIMKQSKLNNIESESTFFRRASTILKWIEWIVEQIED